VTAPRGGHDPREGQARTRVLVVGIPRSGTTWLARILAAAVGAEVLDEPDNHFVSPYAFRVKHRLGQGNYPRVRAGDEAPEYGSLWRAAFAHEGRRRAAAERARRALSRRLLAREASAHITRTLTRTEAPHPGLRAAAALALPEQPALGGDAVVVKSVYAGLSLDWIASFSAPSIAIILRHPLNVLSSWLELDWLGDDVLETLDLPLQEELAARYGVPLPAPDATTIARAAWVSGALTSALADVGAVRDGPVLVTHEELCRSPHDGFRAIVDRLRLDWNVEAERLLAELNRPGRGYETARVAQGLEDVWRRRLSREQAREAMTVLEHFPLDPWSG
jgi:hypothetical protein